MVPTIYFYSYSRKGFHTVPDILASHIFDHSEDLPYDLASLDLGAAMVILQKIVHFRVLPCLHHPHGLLLL